MKKVLVTGGLGFVGTHLLPSLLALPEVTAVTVIDVLNYTANPERLSELAASNKFNFVHGDILDRALTNQLVAEHDYIINLAAQTFVDNSIADSGPFFETNVLGMLAILEAARVTPPRNILHVSTDEVWGEAKDERRFREDTPYAPRNPYAASKASADHILMAFSNTYGLSSNIVHLPNLLGPYQYPEKLIPASIVSLLTGRQICLHGSGNYARTWLDVSDAVTGILTVFCNGRDGERFIFGTEYELTNAEVIRRLLEFFGLGWDRVTYVPNRPGQDTRYAVDFSKARSTLGWHPTMTFDQSLARMAEWFVSNPEWWKPRVRTVRA